MRPRAFYGLILACFFLSGATSLIYEVVWARMLALIFGVTAFAISTVLAAFMGGLAAGAAIFGRWSHRIRNPILFYGVLEGLIGLYALLVPHIFQILQKLYISMYTGFSLEDNVILYGVIRFLLAGIVLLLPTILMGGSLPLIARFYADRKDRRVASSRVAVIYGINTFGAVTGTACSGFLLLPLLGIARTTHAAVLVNLLLSIVVVVAALKSRLVSSKPAEAAPDQAPLAGDTGLGAREGPVIGVVLGAFFLSGAISMGYEVYWTRILSLILGPSVYAFTLMLTAFLAGLALGSAIISRYLLRVRDYLLLFASLEFVIAFTCLVSMFLFSRYPYWFVQLSNQTGGGERSMELLRFFFALITMLFPTLAMGAIFPIVAGLHYRRLGRIAASVGSVYSYNTVGGIIGSFLAGFLLLPYLGVRNGMALFVGLNAAIGLVLLSIAAPSRPRRWVGGIAAAGFLLLIGAHQGLGLTIWDKEKMTIGPYQRAIRNLGRDPERIDRFVRQTQLVYYAEGISATITVRKRGEDITLQTNGKTDASTGADMRTQVLMGQFPLILRGGADETLVIGLASGVSVASVLAQGSRHVDVVEIEETMIGAARFFDKVNGGLLDDPRATIIVNDGRNHVLASEKDYDVIISQPSNPWISGVNNLFTLEAFRLFRERLAPGGLVCQWIQYYEMLPEDLLSLLRTFAEVFEYVDVFRPARGDLLLVGGSRPIPFVWSEIEERMKSSPNCDIFRAIGLSGAADLLASYLFTIEREKENEAWRAVRGFPLNRDDNMLLEFSMPRHMEEPRLEENRLALGRLHDRSKVHRAAPHRHLELARGAVKLWDLPVAELELALAAAEDTPDVAGIHALRARILLLRAGWENRPGLVEEAVRETELALDADSSSSEAHFLVGTIALQRSDWAEAAGSFRRAIELGEDPAVAYVYLGRAHEGEGKLGEAADAYSRALQEGAENPVARNALERVRSRSR